MLLVCYYLYQYHLYAIDFCHWAETLPRRASERCSYEALSLSVGETHSAGGYRFCFHLGQHRLLDHRNGGKLSPYTHDVELPMYVRGPGIRPESVSEAMVSNVDIAPTFAEMARPPDNPDGTPEVPSFVDGRSMLPLAKGEPVEWRDFAYSAAWPKSEGTRIPMADWRQSRTQREAYHYYPNTGEEELYDLSGDPYQLENLLHGAVSEEEETLRNKYRELSERMNACSGARCRAIEVGM
jgi:N-acetylglucosamine-6-sulfatase